MNGCPGVAVGVAVGVARKHKEEMYGMAVAAVGAVKGMGAFWPSQLR